MKTIFIAFAAIMGTLTLVGLEPANQLTGAFSTSLEARTASQRHNVEIAVRRLNGAVIKPGETFSFNGRVGTYSRDQGYRRAPVSYNGTLISSWGGGVCQVSTTLYNAALLAGLDVVERSRHRYAPGYVAPGRDAAVAYNNLDLKLRNTTGSHLQIKASIEGSQLRVALTGAAPPKVRVYTDFGSISRPFVVTNGSGPSSRVRNQGKVGCDVRVFREMNGRVELISQDSYPVMHRVIQRS
ncbi:MAG TPA: VanW family protein [Fimbriimonadaceae bacterium]|nr:VanW family protein [Fimbriimonadaceae bacterium]